MIKMFEEFAFGANKMYRIAYTVTNNGTKTKRQYYYQQANNRDDAEQSIKKAFDKEVGDPNIKLHVEWVMEVPNNAHSRIKLSDQKFILE